MTGSRSLQKTGGKRRRARRQRGGVNAPNPSSYTSASSWGSAVNGSGDSQFARTFEGPGSGPGVYSSVQGNKVGGGKSVLRRVDSGDKLLAKHWFPLVF